MTTQGRQFPARPDAARVYAWFLFASGLALYLLLSAPTLAALGIAYEAPNGPFFVKLHPGTWLILLAYIVMLAGYGNPLRTIAAQLAADPLIAGYLACLLCVLSWTLYRHGTAGANIAAVIVESLLMPAVGVLALSMVSLKWQYKCLASIAVLLIINTLFAVGESLAQTRLITIRLPDGSDAVEEIFRPAALLGHPLTNAIVTASLMPAVLYLRVRPFWRGLAFLVLWLGLLSFGGRTAFAVATLGYGLYFTCVVCRSMVQGRYSYLQLTGGAAAGMAIVAAVAGAIMATGIGERIFRSLSIDGSAAVRYRIWDVLDYLNEVDMMIGVSPKRIGDLGKLIGLNASEAIENFWLVYYLELGWIGFVPFMLAMIVLLVWLWRRTQGAMRIGVVVFFVVASSYNSLATKTMGLAMLAITTEIARRLHNHRLIMEQSQKQSRSKSSAQTGR